jgi:hypothetical protein
MMELLRRENEDMRAALQAEKDDEEMDLVLQENAQLHLAMREMRQVPRGESGAAVVVAATAGAEGADRPTDHAPAEAGGADGFETEEQSASGSSGNQQQPGAEERQACQEAEAGRDKGAKPLQAAQPRLRAKRAPPKKWAF